MSFKIFKNLISLLIFLVILSCIGITSSNNHAFESNLSLISNTNNLRYLQNKESNNQWLDILLPKQNEFELVNDVSFKDIDNSLEFKREESSKDNSDIGGAAWYNTSISHSKGLKISFSPYITVDNNFAGNVKYPQGFAIVLTSSNPKNLIGRKGSGLGYDSINRAVVFEFDFIKNSDSDDDSGGRFSVSANLEGPVSSNNKEFCNVAEKNQPGKLCNVVLGNFYDYDKSETFTGEKEFKIEIYGGKLTFYTENTTYVSNAIFPYLDRLMENNEVYIGITSSMSLYKSVIIKDFSVSKIDYNKFYNFELINKIEHKEIDSDTNDSMIVQYNAGEDIVFGFTLKSFANNNLKIFKEEFKMISLNNKKQALSPSKIVFNEETYVLEVYINNFNKSGNQVITALLKNKTQLGKSISINVLPGKSNLLEIISPNIINNNELNFFGVADQSFYDIKLKVTDQFKNEKKASELKYDFNSLFKVEYPNMIKLNNENKELQFFYNDDENLSPNNYVNIKSLDLKDSEFILRVPVIAAGNYKIVSKYFFFGMEVNFNVKNSGLDEKNSFGEIIDYFNVKKNYINNINTKSDDSYKVELVIRAFDSFGDKVETSNILSNYKIELIRRELLYEEDVTNISDKLMYDDKLNVFKLIYKPNKIGVYKFKIYYTQKEDERYNQIACNKCIFFVLSNIVSPNILLYSDYLNKDVHNLKLYDPYYYIKNNKGSIENSNNGYLPLSLDNINSNLITTIKFLDTSNYWYFLYELDKDNLIKINDLKVNLVVDSESKDKSTIELLSSSNPIKGISFYLPHGITKKSLNLSPTKSYSLIVSCKNINLNNEEIKVKFLYIDNSNNNSSKVTKISSLALTRESIQIERLISLNDNTVEANLNIPLYKISVLDNEAKMLNLLEDNDNNILCSHVKISISDNTNESNNFYCVKVENFLIIYGDLISSSYDNYNVLNSYKISLNINYKNVEKIVNDMLKVLPNKDYIAELQFDKDLVNMSENDNNEKIVSLKKINNSSNTVVFKMIDKFGNKINCFNMYNTITYSNIREGVKISYIEDGHIVYSESSKDTANTTFETKIHLNERNLTYIIHYDKDAYINEDYLMSIFNPYMSIVENNNKVHFIDNNNKFSTYIDVKDSNGNYLNLFHKKESLNILSRIKDNILIYLMPINLDKDNVDFINMFIRDSNEIILLDNVSTEIQNNKNYIKFSLSDSNLLKTGEYELIALYKNSFNIPIDNKYVIIREGSINKKALVLVHDTFCSYSLSSKRNEYIDLSVNNLVFEVKYLDSSDNSIRIKYDKYYKSSYLSPKVIPSIKPQDIFIEIISDDDKKTVIDQINFKLTENFNSVIIEAINLENIYYSNKAYASKINKAKLIVKNLFDKTSPNFEFNINLYNSNNLNNEAQEDIDLNYTNIYYSKYYEVNPTHITSYTDNIAKFIVDFRSNKDNRRNIKVDSKMFTIDVNEKYNVSYKVIPGPLTNQLSIVINSNTSFENVDIILKYNNINILENNFNYSNVSTISLSNINPNISQITLLDSDKNIFSLNNNNSNFSSNLLNNEIYYKIQLNNDSNQNKEILNLNYNYINDIANDLISFKFNVKDDLNDKKLVNPNKFNIDYKNGIITYFFNAIYQNEVDIILNYNNFIIKKDTKFNLNINKIYLKADLDNESKNINYKIYFEDFSGNNINKELENSLSNDDNKKEILEKLDFKNSFKMILKIMSPDNIDSIGEEKNILYTDSSNNKLEENGFSSNINISHLNPNDVILLIPYLNNNLLTCYNCRINVSSKPGASVHNNIDDNITEILNTKNTKLYIKNHNNWHQLYNNNNNYDYILYKQYPVLKLSLSSLANTKLSNIDDSIIENISLTMNIIDNEFTFKPVNVRFNTSGEILYILDSEQRSKFKNQIFSKNITKRATISLIYNKNDATTNNIEKYQNIIIKLDDIFNTTKLCFNNYSDYRILINNEFNSIFTLTEGSTMIYEIIKIGERYDNNCKDELLDNPEFEIKLYNTLDKSKNSKGVYDYTFVPSDVENRYLLILNIDYGFNEINNSRYTSIRITDSKSDYIKSEFIDINVKKLNMIHKVSIIESSINDNYLIDILSNPNENSISFKFNIFNFNNQQIRFEDNMFDLQFLNIFNIHYTDNNLISIDYKILYNTEENVFVCYILPNKIGTINISSSYFIDNSYIQIIVKSILNNNSEFYTDEDKLINSYINLKNINANISKEDINNDTINFEASIYFYDENYNTSYNALVNNNNNKSLELPENYEILLSSYNQYTNSIMYFSKCYASHTSSSLETNSLKFKISCDLEDNIEILKSSMILLKIKYMNTLFICENCLFSLNNNKLIELIKMNDRSSFNFLADIGFLNNNYKMDILINKNYSKSVNNNYLKQYIDLTYSHNTAFQLIAPSFLDNEKEDTNSIISKFGGLELTSYKFKMASGYNIIIICDLLQKINETLSDKESAILSINNGSNELNTYNFDFTVIINHKTAENSDKNEGYYFEIAKINKSYYSYLGSLNQPIYRFKCRDQRNILTNKDHCNIALKIKNYKELGLTTDNKLMYKIVKTAFIGVFDIIINDDNNYMINLSKMSSKSNNTVEIEIYSTILKYENYIIKNINHQFRSNLIKIYTAGAIEASTINNNVLYDKGKERFEISKFTDIYNNLICDERFDYIILSKLGKKKIVFYNYSSYSKIYYDKLNKKCFMLIKNVSSPIKIYSKTFENNYLSINNIKSNYSLLNSEITINYDDGMNNNTNSNSFNLPKMILKLFDKNNNLLDIKDYDVAISIYESNDLTNKLDKISLENYNLINKYDLLASSGIDLSNWSYTNENFITNYLSSITKIKYFSVFVKLNGVIINTSNNYNNNFSTSYSNKFTFTTLPKVEVYNKIINQDNKSDINIDSNVVNKFDMDTANSNKQLLVNIIDANTAYDGFSFITPSNFSSINRLNSNNFYLYTNQITTKESMFNNNYSLNEPIELYSTDKISLVLDNLKVKVNSVFNLIIRKLSNNSSVVNNTFTNQNTINNLSVVFKAYNRRNVNDNISLFNFVLVNYLDCILAYPSHKDYNLIVNLPRNTNQYTYYIEINITNSKNKENTSKSIPIKINDNDSFAWHSFYQYVKNFYQFDLSNSKSLANYKSLDDIIKNSESYILNIYNQADNQSKVYTNESIFSNNVLCLSLEYTQNNNKKILNSYINDYIDTNKITFTDISPEKEIEKYCSTYIKYLDNDNKFSSDLHRINQDTKRGCIIYSINCKNSFKSGKLQVMYNNTKFSSDLFVEIDPLKPTNVVVVKPFPNKIIQNQDLIAEFKLYNNNESNFFKYIKQKNIEIYMNFTRINNFDLKCSSSDGLCKLIIPKIFYSGKNNHNYDSKTIVNSKKVMIDIVYKDNADNEYSLSDLNSNVTIVQENFNIEYTKLGLPEYLKAGDPLNVTIILLDNSKECYEGEFDINRISLSVPDYLSSSDFDYYHKSIESSTCKKAIFATTKEKSNTLIKVNYDKPYTAKLEIRDKELKEVKFKLEKSFNIFPNEIDTSKSKVTTNTGGINSLINVKAGESFELIIVGTDKYDNEVDFTRYSKTLNLYLIDNTSQEKEKLLNPINYSFIKYEDKESIKFKVTIKEIGMYQLKFYNKVTNDDDLNKTNYQFNYKDGIRTIRVEAGDCSGEHANINAINQKIFSGEVGSLEIRCKDVYGNKVYVKGNEHFEIKIYAIELDTIGNTNTDNEFNANFIKNDRLPYKMLFNNGTYFIKFTPVYSGKYSVDIYLNGKNYGNTIKFEVLSLSCPNNKPIMCSDRHCVPSIDNCPEEDKLNPKCTENGFSEECDGYCLPENAENNFCKKEVLSNCETPDILTKKLLIKKDEEATISSCKDGSCRIKTLSMNNIDECGNDLACPIGYIFCGSTCYPKETDCKNDKTVLSRLKNKCEDSKVLCWDNSCAKNITLCPTRKTCSNKNYVVCPDGLCVEKREYCLQPPQCFAPNKVLCPDFTCKASEELCEDKKVCLDGMMLCENNKCAYVCNDNPCQPGMYRCQTGECVINKILCSNTINCPENYVTCPNLGCAVSYNKCEFIHSPNNLKCPIELPYLCSDFSCTDNPNKCINNSDCPIEAPYKCKNNECRKNLSECPTEKLCPKEAPVLCANGLCTTAAYNCKLISDENLLENLDSYEKDQILNDGCINKSYSFFNDFDNNNLRCANGQCVSALGLCPTNITCLKDQIKCWDGSCSNNIAECPKHSLSICSTEAPVRCNDGSCRQNLLACFNNISTCPIDKPIKCYDNSCRESIELCPKYVSCGFMRKACPDGTCSDIDKLCNTPVSCPPNKPYKCYDNTCRKDLYDCPDLYKTNKKCIYDKMFLCPDGSCTHDRNKCLTLNPCPPQSPIRCSYGSCVKNLEACNNSELNECPIGYTKCESEVCRIDVNTCPKLECPIDRPYQCPEGVCVEEKKYCDNSKNGCPFNKPYKSKDGTCVKSTSDIINHTSVVCTKDNYVVCPNGSCAERYELCPSINGCPENYTACADGSCKENGVEKCKISICPISEPIKCLNGLCVESNSMCPNNASIQGYLECDKEFPNKGYSMCADGRCVPSPDHCRPVLNCPKDHFKCDDLTCKLSLDLCPKSSQNCPESKPVRCSRSGICSVSLEDCNRDNSCEDTGLLRCNNNRCVTNLEDCHKLDKENEKSFYGCPENKFKCIDGRCLNSIEECQKVSVYCSSEYPIFCPQLGFCRKTAEECNYIEDNSTLRLMNEEIEDQTKNIINNENIKEVSETDKTNHSNNKNKHIAQEDINTKSNSTKETKDITELDINTDNEKYCRPQSKDDNYLRCPITEKCVHKDNYNLYCINNIGCNYEKPYRCVDGSCSRNRYECKSKTACNSLLPYKCPDGSCVYNKSNCKILLRCPLALPERCSNSNLCVASQTYCTDLSEFCPVASPIKCNSGKCVSSPRHCSHESLIRNCNENEYYCSKKGICVKSANDCLSKNVILNLPVNSKNNISRNLEENINKDINEIVEDHQTKPHSTCNKDYPYLCFDGTCQKSIDLCSLNKPCKAMEFKCQNGQCVDNQLLCNSNIICSKNNKLCNDGICRDFCPEFNGCSNENPFMCSNGQCVPNINYCVGYGGCFMNTEKAYKCFDGLCVKDPKECSPIYRLFNDFDVLATISKFDSIDIDFVYDNNNALIGNLYIPANALNIDNSHLNDASDDPQGYKASMYNTLRIKSVPHSQVYKWSYNSSEFFTSSINNVLPNSDGNLNFENSIMSPIFEISTELKLKSNNLKTLGYLKLEHNYYRENEDKYNRILHKDKQENLVNLKLNKNLNPNDYCLAKLIKEEIKTFDKKTETDNIEIVYKPKCVFRKKTFEDNIFSIDSLGTYTVILNPYREYSETYLKGNSNFVVKNLTFILIGLAIFIVVATIVIYIFSRILRYREKYKEHKLKSLNLQNQIKEFRNMGTDVPGQTLNDNINGIVFTKNPIHKIENIEKGSTLELEIKLEELERKCKLLNSNNITREEEYKTLEEEYMILKSKN